MKKNHITRSLTRSLLFLLLIFILFSCASTYDQRGKISSTSASTLHGMVYCGNGQAVGNAEIRIDQQGKIRTVYSDTLGRFLLPDVRPGIFNVFVSKTGYLDIEKTDLLHDRSRILYINMKSWQNMISLVYSHLKQGNFEAADEILPLVKSSAPEEWLPIYVDIISRLLRNDIVSAEKLMTDLHEGTQEKELRKYIDQQHQRQKASQYE
ncbi:carboxypeptidase-like regulatory domain-containing protein [Spirochaeta dissipatitropha]